MQDTNYMTFTPQTPSLEQQKFLDILSNDTKLFTDIFNKKDITNYNNGPYYRLKVPSTLFWKCTDILNNIKSNETNDTLSNSIFPTLKEYIQRLVQEEFYNHIDRIELEDDIMYGYMLNNDVSIDILPDIYITVSESLIEKVIKDNTPEVEDVEIVIDDENVKEDEVIEEVKSTSWWPF